MYVWAGRRDVSCILCGTTSRRDLFDRVRPRLSLLMRCAVPSSESAARCAVGALRTSLHACAWLTTSHSPSLASSSREWVPVGWEHA